MQLKNVPEGMLVYNIEGAPGGGGKIARSPGAFAIVVERTKKGVNVRLPSGKRKLIHPKSLATLGVVSGGGVASKPFMKAGHKYYYMKTKASNWPRVTCATMNATSHPHGGGAKRTPGRSTTVGRHAPPGRKVGMIAARQSGRKRSKKNK